MDNVIKKIFLENLDDSVHNDFIKFGMGEFRDRYLINAKKQKNGWVIKSTAEFSNFFVRKILKKVQDSINVKGVIICTFDLTKEINFQIEKIKKYMGIQQYIINTRINPLEIINLMDKYPRVHFGLSFSFENYQLKIKPKAPKSAKPSPKGESSPKIDFCRLKTTDVDLINDLFFDFPSFKEIYINHTIKIDKIIIPSGINNPVKMRELAKKKGKIIRKVIIDGKEIIKEKEFEV